MTKAQARGACDYRRFNQDYRRLQDIHAKCSVEAFGASTLKNKKNKNVSSGVEILKMRSSLFACNVWETQASGALNHRRFN